MAWRKANTHKEETAQVKAALSAAGINAKVTHGRGTGWGWMRVNIGNGSQWGEHVPVTDGSGRFCGYPSGCRRCLNINAMRERAERIVAEVTGRGGEYGGCVNILTQDEWSDAQYKKTGDGSRPIEQPKWQDVTATQPVTCEQAEETLAQAAAAEDDDEPEPTAPATQAAPEAQPDIAESIEDGSPLLLVYEGGDTEPGQFCTAGVRFTDDELRDRELLRDLATQIAEGTAGAINKLSAQVETPTMPYKAQWILEEVVKLLSEAV
jgi:hypothetical protein